METTEEAWGQLVSTTEMDSEPVTVSKSTFTIGRNPVSDFCFNGNKLVSSTHCILSRDGDGKTWLEDKSTNGTLINLKTKISKQKVELQHGDEIHVVYRKTNPETNIAFVFQDTEKLKQETSDSTLDYDPSETDVATSEPDPLPIQTKNTELDESLLASPISLPTTTGGTDRKRKRVESNTDELPSKKANISEESPSVSGKGSGDASTSTDITTGEEQAKTKVDDNHENQKAATSKESEPKATTKDETMDEIEESLMCIICQEIFYKCISLQPCMHSFCAGCYSDWMPQSDECPSCRSKVTRINKNHLVNNLVESYLKANPGKQRPAEDIAEQDTKNKITTDMLYPKEQLKRASDEDFSSSSSVHSGSDSNSSSSDSDYHPYSGEDVFRTVIVRPPEAISPPPPRVIITGRIAPPSLAAPGFGMMRLPAKVICRQCPEYVGPLPTGRDAAGAKAAKLFKAPAPVGTAPTAAGSFTTDGAGPSAGPSAASPGGAVSLPDGKTLPTVPNYTCTPAQTHKLCQCCMQPFPDQTADRQQLTLPPTSCTLCYRNFCHAYWGCYKGCNGCISVFSEMNFGRSTLRHVVNDNIYESAILENYLGTKNMSVRDLLNVCLRRMDGGAYFTADKQIGTTPLSADTVVCQTCGLRNLKELAYQYRRDIPKAELPGGVTSRPDCHWGKNCRTQRNKPNHAARFNHICEQTKAA